MQCVRECLVHVRMCVEKECVQRCSVFTSGVRTRVCEGLCRGCVRECSV